MTEQEPASLQERLAEADEDEYYAAHPADSAVRATPSVEARLREALTNIVGLVNELRRNGYNGYQSQVGFIEDQALQASAPSAAAEPDPIDDALQYALAFLNDPEGLASAREEWRDKVRAALHSYRAAAEGPTGPEPPPDEG